MRKFDPWPIFFRREWNRNWPFLIGFAVTGAIVTKLSLGLTEEDAKNSSFVQRHKRADHIFFQRSVRCCFLSILLLSIIFVLVLKCIAWV